MTDKKKPIAHRSPTISKPSKVAEKKVEEPKSFTVTKVGVNDIATCINDVVASKYVRTALFAALNEHLKPVF